MFFFVVGNVNFVCHKPSYGNRRCDVATPLSVFGFLFFLVFLVFVVLWFFVVFVCGIF